MRKCTQYVSGKNTGNVGYRNVELGSSWVTSATHVRDAEPWKRGDNYANRLSNKRLFFSH